MAANNNPTVLAALFNDAAAKDAIDVAFAQLMPQVSFQGQVFQSNNATARSSQANGYQAVVQLSVPVYQGGAEYSAVRQARQSAQQTTQQVDDARRTAVQNAVQAWETAGRGQSLGRQHTGGGPRQRDRPRRRGARGHRRQPHHARRAERAADLAEFAGHAGAEPRADCHRIRIRSPQAIGRLTAHDLHLPVPLYDETAYYNAVKNKWVGLGDYATDQPGR